MTDISRCRIPIPTIRGAPKLFHNHGCGVLCLYGLQNRCVRTSSTYRYVSWDQRSGFEYPQTSNTDRERSEMLGLSWIFSLPVVSRNTARQKYRSHGSMLWARLLVAVFLYAAKSHRSKSDADDSTRFLSSAAPLRARYVPTRSRTCGNM